MWRTLLKYGLISGVIVGLSLLAVSLAYDGQPPPTYGMALGYTSMLVALTAVFVGVKHHRDHALGGVIRFWPAFGLGLGISVVAGVLYALSWELAMVLIDQDFAKMFGDMMLDRARSQGLQGDALARAAERAESFTAMYRNPLVRLPMSFAEIFPVGLLVSLVSALVLRNPRRLALRG